jgi:hypothetical protein
LRARATISVKQFVEVPDAALARRVQASRNIRSAREPALHRFADRDVFGLHGVGKRPVLLAERGTGTWRIEIIEVDAATLRIEGDDAIGLQPAGQHVEHRVRPQPPIERFGRA